MTRELVKTFIVFLALSATSYAQNRLGGTWPRGGGPITITTIDPIVAGGLDIKASGPYLSNGSNPAPWAFYITGNDGVGKTQVTLGSLGSAPTLDGSLTLDVSVSAEARTGDISATWGDGLIPTSFNEFCIEGEAPCVPEPNAAMLASLPLLFALGLRRRRR